MVPSPAGTVGAGAGNRRAQLIRMGSLRADDRIIIDEGSTGETVLWKPAAWSQLAGLYPLSPRASLLSAVSVEGTISIRLLSHH